jgi:outer membrane protein TolC
VKTEALQKQSLIYASAVQGYRRLLKQEEFKLNEGESTLFKLTLREIKMLTASAKLIDLNLKLIKAKTSLIHSRGELYLSE